VEWGTIETVAGTEGIDLWYLFPAGLGVHRQIGRDGTVHDTHEASLDRLFGTPTWREACIADDDGRQPELPGLLAQEVHLHVRIASPDSITRFMIARMKTVFKGGVLDDWLPLGPRGHHSYSLIFAWANPSEKAKKAGKIAQAVMRSGGLGRT
jgi:three-Cys-motif partner protein